MIHVVHVMHLLHFNDEWFWSFSDILFRKVTEELAILHYFTLYKKHLKIIIIHINVDYKVKNKCHNSLNFICGYTINYFYMLKYCKYNTGDNRTSGQTL